MNDRLALAAKFMGGGTRRPLLNDGTPNPASLDEIDNALAFADLLIARESETRVAALHPKTSPPPAGPAEAPRPASTPEPGGGDLPLLRCDECGARVSSNVPSAMEEWLAEHKASAHPAKPAVEAPGKDAPFWGRAEPKQASHLWRDGLSESECMEETCDGEIEPLPGKPPPEETCLTCAAIAGVEVEPVRRAATYVERCLAPGCPNAATFERCCDTHNAAPKSIKLEWLRDRAAAEGKPTRGRRGAPKDPGTVRTPPAEGRKRIKKLIEQVEAAKEPGAAT